MFKVGTIFDKFSSNPLTLICMKRTVQLLSLLFLLIIPSTISAQKIKAGLYSGINFSDIHGSFTSGKHTAKTGPVQGLLLEYSFNKVLGIQTGLDYTTLYYEYLPYIDKNRVYPLYDIMPYYYYPPVTEKMDFTFLRIPLLFKLSTPTRLQYNLEAGLYYSFLQDYSLNYLHNIKPVKKDFGFIYSTGLSYSLSSNFQASLGVRYLTGRREFLESTDYRHGSTELILGFDYNGLLNKAFSNRPVKTRSDSTVNKVFLEYKWGMNLSWNSGNINKEKYILKPGMSFGLSVNYHFYDKVSLQSEILFERKGYALKDSSASYFRYIHNDSPMYSVDTKVDIDYIELPVLVNIIIGKSGMFNITTGPYLGLKLNSRCTGVAVNEYASQGSYLLREIIVYDDIDGLIKDNDWGWIFRGGFTIPVGKKRINLDFQYNKGFKDILKNQKREDGDVFIRNGSVGVLLGYKIPIY